MHGHQVFKIYTFDHTPADGTGDLEPALPTDVVHFSRHDPDAQVLYPYDLTIDEVDHAPSYQWIESYPEHGGPWPLPPLTVLLIRVLLVMVSWHAKHGIVFLSTVVVDQEDERQAYDLVCTERPEAQRKAPGDVQAEGAQKARPSQALPV